MSPLVIQIMILIASFLFYRILRQGFDSWRALLIDFGVVIFLFGLQYYLQSKQNEQAFPSGALSSYFGTNFPSRIAIGNISEKISTKGGIQLQIKNDTYFEPMNKKILKMNKIHGDNWLTKNDHIEILKSGFYLLQVSCHTDLIPYSAKLSIHGKENHIEKSVHHGENSLVLYLNRDLIQFELENTDKNISLLHHTTFTLLEF
jgi:hypothetical protein